MIETGSYVIEMKHALVVFAPKEVSPVVMSIPHDCLPPHEFSGFFASRSRGFIGRDMHVWPIAKDILASVAMSAVRGLMPRTLIDYNRTQDQAFDDARLAKAYLHYHASIERMLERVITEFGKEKALLIDLHGFTKQPFYAPEGGYDLILGTGNRASIVHGNIDEACAQYMSGLGYSVFLPREKKQNPVEFYDGGFITRHYSEKFGINALQIEIASRFRKEGAVELGQKLSQDFAGFIKSTF